MSKIHSGSFKKGQSGNPKGRKENIKLLQNIELLLSEGKSYNSIISLLGCSRGTIATVSNRKEGLPVNSE